MAKRFGQLSHAAQASLLASLWVVVLSLAFWVFGPVKQPGILVWNRLWLAALGLSVVGVTVLGAAMGLVWILYDRKPLRRTGIDAAVFLVSGGILSILIAVGLQVDESLREAQLDIVEALCVEAFDDPDLLDKYGYDKLPVGGWDYVSVIEDESHNAIWIDNCNSLSSCGVVCIRPGVELADSSAKFDYREFKYLRDGLYSWH